VSYSNAGLPQPALGARLTVQTDQVGGGKEFILYNALGHPIQHETRTPNGSFSVVETHYTGKVSGQVAAVSRPYFFAIGHAPDLQLTTLEYDPLGRLTKETLPDTSATRYAYAGRTTAVTDPKGNVTSSMLDELGRLAKRDEMVYVGGGLGAGSPSSFGEYAGGGWLSGTLTCRNS